MAKSSGALVARLGQPALLAVLAALNLGLGFAFQWLPAAVLGVGTATDALFVSAVVPQVLLAVASSGLTSVLTPMLATTDPDAFSVRAWTYAFGVGLAALALNGVVFALAPVWVPWLVPGFDPAARILTVRLVRIQSIGAIATMVLMVTWSAHYARHRFAWVEISGAIAGAIGLGAAWGGVGVGGVVAVAWAMSLRSVLQCLLLLRGLGPYSHPRWQAAGGATVWRRLLPLMSGATYYKLDPMVERLLASFAPAGQLSLFHLAQLGYSAGNQILTRAIINPVMPTLATLASARKWSAFERLARRRLFLATGLAVSAWLVVLVAGRPVLRLGLAPWMDVDQIDILHGLLLALLGVWLGGAAGQVLTVGFFAVGNTDTPTRVGVVGFTLAIPLKIVCYRWGGILGLALAASLYTMGTAAAHYVLLRRDLRARVALAPSPVS